MCEPVTIMATAAVVASAASAGLGIQGQIQQRKAQVEYQNRLTEANAKQMQENRDLATEAYLNQATAANRQLAESREAAASANFDRSRQAIEARGQVLVSGAEAGVYGVSLNDLLADFHRQEDMFRGRNEQNLLFRQQQTAAQVRGYQSEAFARALAVKPYQPSPIAPVDYFGPALQVVKDAGTTGMRLQGGAAKGVGKAGGGGGPYYSWDE